MPMKSAAALGLMSVMLLGCSQTNPAVRTRFNGEAALTGPLPWNPMQGEVVASWIDRGNGTMSTLFGNDLAAKYARTHAKHSYPAGSKLSLVTWKEQDDARWFGARIPSTARRAEFVTVGVASNGSATYTYQKFTGSPLRQVATEQAAVPGSGAANLLEAKAAVLP